MNRLYDIFVKTVARNRCLSEEDVRSMEAATFFGEKAAIKVGLADELSSQALQKISEESMDISKVSIKGEKMTEDIGEQVSAEKAVVSEVDAYKAEVLEISKLCKLTKTENKIAEFIEHGLTAEQVKEKLLAEVDNTQTEIVSAIYQKEDRRENPVLAAARARVK